MMDRVWLIVLALAGAVATGLPTGDAPMAATPEAPSVVSLEAPRVSEVTPTLDASPTGSSTVVLEGPAVPESAPTLDETGKTAVELVLERLAMRHTALSARERLALAETIVSEAHAHDLDPDLVMGVIEVESAGYPLAVSHVGAMGLMQLLPSTGKELAGKLGIEWMGPDTLFDPQINVRLGTAYLRELSDKYDGNVNIALAAYNWGPGRIDRRLRRGASVPSRYIEQVRSAVDRYASIVPARS